jgi:microsomal dipeptidase-like Zn-dependent dipeptidase
MGIEHVALGSDFIDQVIQAELAAGKPLNPSTQEAMDLGGGRLAIQELVGPADYPALLEALRRRGYEGERLDAIALGNLLRVLRAGLPPT